jgi:hypothetical protein
MDLQQRQRTKKDIDQMDAAKLRSVKTLATSTFSQLSTAP